VRLALKLIAALVVALLAVMVIATWFRLDEEQDFLLADVRDDHVLFARALRSIVVSTWALEGEERARALVRRADIEDRDLMLEIVDTDTLDAPRSTAGARRGRERVFVDADHIVVVEPLALAGQPNLGLLVSQPLDSQRALLSTSLWHATLEAVAVVAACAILMTLLGYIFVGRPVQKLIAEARRIGRRDHTTPVHLDQKDEIGELAREMAQMSEKLDEADVRVESAHRQKLDALDQLRHADRLRTVGQLASGLAHELGTPLNVVSGRARLIEQADGATDEVVADAKIILDQTQRITDLVKQLLGFARRRRPLAQTADLAVTAAHVAQLLTPLAQKRNVRIEFAAPSGPCVTRCDPLLLEQALTNVALNGIQAMPEGGALRMRVLRKLATPPRRPDSEPVPFGVLRVMDEGTGIASENLERIFDPFFTTKDIGDGTGLGLSVVYGILEDHGGFAEVRSEPGKGTEFDLLIPMRDVSIRPPPGPATDAEEEEQGERQS
jgi:two-component system NtrC family sensor kinase